MATEVSLSQMSERLKSESSPSKDNEVSVLDVLMVFAQRKRAILWITAVFAIGSVIISLLLPRRYTATVTLLPPQQNSSMASALAAQLGNLSGMAALTGGSLGKNPNDMYVGMLRGRTVEDGMVTHFGLMQEYHAHFLSEARKKFEHYASVDGAAKDGMLHIAVVDPDPKRAAELANGYVQEFRDLSEHLAITEASQRRTFFERQLEQEKDKLADAEEALKKTEQQTGLIQLDSQAKALIETAASLRAQITAKQVQIESMETYATNQNSQVVQAEQELESLRAQLAKLGGSEAGEESLIVPKGRVPEAGLEYVRKLRDVKYHETVFDILARQFEIAKLDEAKEGSVIQVVDAAVPPDKPSFPRKTVIVLGATGVGFIVAIFIALLQAGYERMTQNPETAVKIGMLRRALNWNKPRA
ncbi:MAG TPA: GNVR domain-containing protein [Terracidiphilus sp.]|jgi:uncharacterized protein involved in exopolysaccharide biosynthesis|nr:GNVR domain-containing protein [Terracidiphilus sp.]